MQTIRTEKPAGSTIAGRVETWSREHAERPSAKWWLAAISFTEGALLPIPPDILLIAILSVRAHAWRFLALLTTLFSVAGGLAGYLIGAVFFDVFGQKIIEVYGLEGAFASVASAFGASEFLVIFLSAFTPVPYKIFALAAGVLRSNIPIFIVASLLGRGARFFLLGYIMSHFGENIGRLIFKYFNIFLLVAVGAATVFLVMHVW